MMIWLDLSWSKTWIISRYKNRLDCCDKSMTCVQTNALGDAICENVLHILDIGAPKPRFWRGPDQLLLAGTSENDQPAGEIWANEPLCWCQNCKNTIDCLRKLSGSWKVDKIQVPRHSDLWKRFRKPDTYPSRGWILEDKNQILLCRPLDKWANNNYPVLLDHHFVV